MRVDVDARALRLLEEHLQVAEVMAGDQDPRAVSDADVDLSRLGSSVCVSIGRIEVCHALHAISAALKYQLHKIICAQTVIKCRSKRPLYECVDFFVILKQNVCMLGIGRKALEPIGEELAQAANVLVLRGEHADRRRLGGKLAL